MHQPKPPADDKGAPEQRLDLFGRRVGSDVEVFRRDPEQKIAHGAADDEGLEARLLQLARDIDRRARKLAPAHRMCVGTEYAR